MRGDYQEIYDVIRDTSRYATFIYDKKLYRVGRPVIENEMEVVAEGIVDVKQKNNKVFILHTDKLVVCDAVSDKSKTYAFDREPFKMELSNSAASMFVAFDDGVTYINYEREYQIERLMGNKHVTDILELSENEYQYIYDGAIYSSHHLSSHITVATMNRRIYKFFNDMPIYDTGFVYNRDFIDVGRRPHKTIRLKNTALALIDNSLYQFEKNGTKVFCGLLHDNVDDMFYDSYEKVILLPSGGDFYCIREIDVDKRMVWHECTEQDITT